MTNKEKNFEIGYKQAMNGMPYNQKLSQYPGYDEGYDAGECDRPTLEELQPIDIGKERNAWYL